MITRAPKGSDKLETLFPPALKKKYKAKLKGLTYKQLHDLHVALAAQEKYAKKNRGKGGPHPVCVTWPN